MKKLRNLVITVAAAAAALGCAAPATAATKPANRTLTLTVEAGGGQLTGATVGTCRTTCNVSIAPECTVWDPVHENICKAWIFPEVEVNAVADAGYAMLTWGGDCTGVSATTRGCTVDMSTNRVISARFAETVAPTISFVRTSSTIVRRIQLTALASDQSGIREVRFFTRDEDGNRTIIAVDDEAPYELEWFQPAGIDHESVFYGATAIDKSPFANSATVTGSIIVDTVAPDTVITSGPADGSTTDDTSAVFTFESPHNDVHDYQCRAYRADDPAPDWFDVCGRGTSAYPGLTPGTWVFEVRAIDAVGNIDGSAASRTWTVSDPTTDPDPADPSPTTPQQPVVVEPTTPRDNPQVPGPVADQLGQPAADASECVVPDVRGKKLRAATRQLAGAGCALGKVRGKKAKGGRVVKQSVPPGTHLAAGATVAVKVRR